MTYTPITQGTLNWDVPVNAAFVDQDTRITVNAANATSNTARITALEGKTVFVRKTADQTIVSTATMTLDTQLIIPVTAGNIYKVEGWIDYTTTSTAGIGLRLNGPTGTMAVNFMGLSGNAAADTGGVRAVVSTNGQNSNRTGGTGGIPADVAAILRGTFLPTASGNVQFAFMQATSDPGNTTIRANSWLELTKVN